MMGFIQNFSYISSSGNGSMVSYVLEFDIVNQDRYKEYQNLDVSVSVSRYGAADTGTVWSDRQSVTYLGSGRMRHFSFTTYPIPRGERIAMTVDVYSHGGLLDRWNIANIVAGDATR